MSPHFDIHKSTHEYSQYSLEMDTSNNNRSNIHDLPNEILFIIANELNVTEVYSLIDTDERFAQILLDPLYIRNLRNLNMTAKTMKSYFDYTFSIDDQLLSRIHEKILLQTRDYINQLTIEQNSIERTFTVSYPQLSSLSLINVQEQTFFQYLTGILLKQIQFYLWFFFYIKDHSILRDLLTHQITHLNIDIQDETTLESFKVASDIFCIDFIFS